MHALAVCCPGCLTRNDGDECHIQYTLVFPVLLNRGRSTVIKGKSGFNPGSKRQSRKVRVTMAALK